MRIGAGSGGGGYVKPTAESRPPRHNPMAAKLVDAERRHLVRRGKALMEKLDNVVGEESDETPWGVETDVRAGRVPAYKVGGIVRIRGTDIEAFALPYEVR